MSETAEVILYYESGSVPSLSLMIALEEKGIEYTTKEVDPDKPSKEFKKLNPREEIPVLKHGDVVLPEFLAACIYLEETFGGTKLIPDDITSEALVLQRMFSAQSIGVGDTTICSYWADYDDDEEDDGQEDEEDEFEDPDEEDAKTDLAEELEIWEEYLKEEGGPFIAGKEFTMADVSFFPVLAYVVWMGFQPKKAYPNLNDYYLAVRDRPTVQDVWPADWNKPSPEKEFLYLDEYLEEEEEEEKPKDKTKAKTKGKWKGKGKGKK
ncbi:GSTZ1 [Branchiostoma lanceolatum]|nr:GSTZ1 [Branchiostoma lanceolatum]